MSVPDPYSMGESLLTAFVAAWTGKKLPANRYVAEGASVAWDGEQVTVVVGDVAPGLPGRPPIGPQIPRVLPVSASYTIEVVRDRGAGLNPHAGGRETTLPTKATNVRAGQQAGADLLAMLSTLIDLRDSGDLVSHSTKILVGRVVPTGPEGRMVGSAGTLTILLGH